MNRPLTRADWQRNYELLPDSVRLSEDERIRLNVNWLLAALYTPNDQFGAVFIRKNLVRLDVSPDVGTEPINWGDLNAGDVRQFTDGTWQVTIEEASPGACPILCEYVRSWLARWGWQVVEVVTEW